MKKIIVNLGDYQTKITLVGDQELLDQITKKAKKIKFYCNGAEFKLVDLFLFEKFDTCLSQQEFWVQSNLFASDAGGNTYFILIGKEYYLILNNNEIRIPMFICHRNNRSWAEMVENCNTLQYTPEKDTKFELVSNGYSPRKAERSLLRECFLLSVKNSIDLCFSKTIYEDINQKFI